MLYEYSYGTSTFAVTKIHFKIDAAHLKSYCDTNIMHIRIRTRVYIEQ